MSTIEKVTAHGRTEIGSTASRRLRTQGIVPGTMYGHKKGAVAIQLDGEVVHALLKDGAKVVDLELNGEVEKALIRETQWDTFSKHILHIDFLRVDPNERVHVEVPVVLRGTAPGVLNGGLLDHHLHTIEVECLAVEIPDSIQVRIGSLKIDGSIHVSDLDSVPRGVTVLTPADAVVVQIAPPMAPEEDEVSETVNEGAEPELISNSEEKEEA